jgi:DNA processing protein
MVDTTENLIGPLNDLERISAPAQLFYRGDRELFRATPKVSIVGSREASEAALKRARKLARALVAYRVVIVSGLAKGIDTAAHTATIDRKGRTIGVLGTPIDKVYPRENSVLQELIATDHLLVSQYPVGEAVRPGNFPRRNRTMALLANATVIVEAGETSGSLAQGWEALRLGRALFIMQSMRDRRDLKWPEKMLEYGARILQDPEQLLESLPFGAHYAAIPA